MQPPDEDEHGKGMPDPIQEESAELQNEIKKLLTEVRTREKVCRKRFFFHEKIFICAKNLANL